MTLASTAQPANANSTYLAAFEAQYPAAVGSRIDSCNLCHTSSIPQLNPYGTAFQGAGHVFAPIESLDSDGDGASNLAEIMALTFPGDAADTPPPAPPTPTETPLSVATPTPTEQATETPTEQVTQTPSEQATQTASVTPSGTLVQTPTNTSGSATVTPTVPGASPTNSPVNPPTATPSRGTATVSPTASTGGTATATALPTRTAASGTTSHIEHEDCSIVAPGSSSGRGVLVLLAPAVLLWARRRRL